MACESNSTLTCTVSASKIVILRSLPPSASNFPSGEISKLVTGFLATVLVRINFQLSTSQTEIKAFLSPLLRPEAEPDLLAGKALTTVNNLDEFSPLPNLAARNVHLRLLLSTGCCMTCAGSGGGSEGEMESVTGQTLILCSDAPRNCRRAV